MNRIGIAIVLLLSLVSTATQAAIENPKINADVVLRSFQKVLDVNRKNVLYLGARAKCEVQCELDAEVIELFDASGKMAACIVRSSDIDIVYGADPNPGTKTSIAWNLKTPQTTTATYKFERPHGVLIVQDDDHATPGQAKPITDPRAVVEHRFKRHHGIVKYYAAVLQTQADGTESLCAAVDPIMVND